MGCFHQTPPLMDQEFLLKRRWEDSTNQRCWMTPDTTGLMAHRNSRPWQWLRACCNGLDKMAHFPRGAAEAMMGSRVPGVWETLVAAGRTRSLSGWERDRHAMQKGSGYSLFNKKEGLREMLCPDSTPGRPPKPRETVFICKHNTS